MSDMVINKRKNGSRLGLERFILDIKKYRLLGIILPVILLIPSLIVQLIWISYDKIVIKYGIDTSLGNGRLLDPERITSGERRIIRILEYVLDEPPLVRGVLWAFTLVLILLVACQIADMFKSFFGSSSALVLATPCSKPILFVSKFLAASVTSFISIWCSQVQWFFIEGGLKWDGSSLKIMSFRAFHGIGSNSDLSIDLNWVSILDIFAIFLLLWLGVFTILAISGKIQKSVKTPVIVAVAIVIAIALSWAFVHSMELQSEGNTLPLLFMIPCILFLADILLISKYDAVTV
ncbi:MAG: hypothetical protein IKI87_06935 [Clostridiales bacterium]|nr:hypothetical protein [Clostridiales bacterium]